MDFFLRMGAMAFFPYGIFVFMSWITQAVGSSNSCGKHARLEPTSHGRRAKPSVYMCLLKRRPLEVQDHARSGANRY